MKGLVKEHVRIIHGHRQQCGDGQREGGGRVLEEGAKWGEMGTSAIVATIKIFLKRINCDSWPHHQCMSVE